MAPLAEGVPEVAIERLQGFLAQNPAAAEQTLARKKLAEALLQAGRPAEVLTLFETPTLTNDEEAVFVHGQALAALERWQEALPLYQRVAANPGAALRVEAMFGAGQALQALGRRDDAIRQFRALESNPKWTVRVRLRNSTSYSRLVLPEWTRMNSRRPSHARLAR